MRKKTCENCRHWSYRYTSAYVLLKSIELWGVCEYPEAKLPEWAHHTIANDDKVNCIAASEGTQCPVWQRSVKERRT